MANSKASEEKQCPSICQRRACPLIAMCPVHPKEDCLLCKVLECREDMDALRDEVAAMTSIQNACLSDMRMLNRQQDRTVAAWQRECVHS